MPRRPKAKQANWRRRLLELSVEVAIALALVVGVVVYAAYGPKKSPVDAKWIVFGVMTAFVFGTVLNLARPLWNKAKLWLTLSALLAVHIAAGWMVLRHFERVGTLWYLPVVLAEIDLIVQLIWAGRRDAGVRCAVKRSRDRSL